MQPIHTLVEILQDRGQRRLPLERMYRHVCREDLLVEAYVKICRNDGSTTPGVDGAPPRDPRAFPDEKPDRPGKPCRSTRG